MKGFTVYHTPHGNFAIWQARLRDELPCSDPDLGNPLLWWTSDLSTEETRGDVIVCGLKTKREAIAATLEHLAEQFQGGQDERR